MDQTERPFLSFPLHNSLTSDCVPTAYLDLILMSFQEEGKPSEPY